jgi:hypothetical protein
MESPAEHTHIDSLYFSPLTSMLFTLKSTPIVAVVSSSDKKSSSVNRSSRDDLPVDQLVSEDEDCTTDQLMNFR